MERRERREERGEKREEREKGGEKRILGAWFVEDFLKSYYLLDVGK